MGFVRPLPGRPVLGMLLVLALTGCRQAPDELSAPARARSSSTSAAPMAAAGATSTADNVARTRAFSAWLLHAVPMPPDAREWRRSPTDHFRTGTLGIGPSDVHFTRSTWWTVPLSSEAFGSWLLAHAPNGLRPDPDAGGPAESRGVWERDQDFLAAGTRAHTRGWVNFAFTAYGEGLVVRVDTFTGARFARTVSVPHDTTSVTIRRTERSIRPGSRPHTSRRTVTDPRAVARLVDLVNRLPGAMTAPDTASCPATLSEVGYAMKFATPTGSYAASLPSTLCWPSLTLLRDGVEVGPPLDPGRRFTAVADRCLRRDPRRQVTAASAGPGPARRPGSPAAR